MEDLKKLRAKNKTKMILGIDVGQKNLGVCVWDAAKKSIAQWAVWESDGTWARDVYTCLEKNATDEFLKGVTKVVIEHQPSKNPSMTRIMHYLEFFFVSQNVPVTLQDSKHKLLFASTTEWFPKDSTDCEWTYRHRKKLAVQTTAAFVDATNQPLRHIFEESKKKDDLADSLLHAMAHSTFGVLGPSESSKTKTIQNKKIVARAPTPKQLRTGRLSPSNVKHFLKNVDPADISEELKKNSQLQRALKKHFGSIDGYVANVKKSPAKVV